MSIFKCKMCGGTLEINENQTTAVCEYCGAEQTLPRNREENIQNLFNRANNLRIKSEFDKAQEIYEKIINADGTDSEAYWGLVLCKYGIEYVEDPATFKRIPTCHRTQIESVLADADYQCAIEHADIAQKVIYEAEAKQIDALQKDILKIAGNEEPFDVFICYKETDENGKRTQDSVIANDIYYQLTQEGFKVFYAAITLEDKLGKEYEPYIFAALSSAKAMIVLGTRPEYFNAVWLRNEWSRYLKFLKTDRSKLLIPCYKDMDAYDLPEEFAHLQAQDMGKIGFINDLVRGIKKVATKGTAKTAIKETVVVSSTNANVAPLLKRAFMFLEDGEFDRADEFCEQVLNQDPENAQAYLGKLMAELHVRKQEDLKNQPEAFDNSNNYQKAVRFADEALKIKLADSLKICQENAIIAEKDKTLSLGKSKMNGNKITNYQSAINIFKQIPGWKDADEQIEICKQKIEQIDEHSKQAALVMQKLEAKRKTRNKKIAIISSITTIAIAACIAFVIVLVNVIIPQNKYNKAIDLYNAGKYEEAIDAFEELNGYKESEQLIKNAKYHIAVRLMNEGKIVEAYEAFVSFNGYADSTNKANSLYEQYKIAKLGESNIGDYITFGTYEQDNNTSNGKEEIEWLVLDKQGNKVLVISKYALDCRRYNTSYREVTWETCSLRTWLNSTFINSAFSTTEKSAIPTVTVSADKNPSYSTNPGNATQDKVFLLSINEANKYFSSDSARKCEGTAYAEAQGASVNSSNGNCLWWLRSPGDLQRYAAYVFTGGGVYDAGYRVNYSDLAVRPALWISVE